MGRAFGDWRDFGGGHDCSVGLWNAVPNSTAVDCSRLCKDKDHRSGLCYGGWKGAVVEYSVANPMKKRARACGQTYSCRIW